MPRTYVDNAYNRSVGRVGMAVGTAVISRSSGGSTGGGSYNSGTSYGSASSTPRTYVDNAYNRSAGRVGLEVGTAVISRSSGGSVGGSSFSSEPRTYVDNSYNRRAGRVGMEVGSAVISRSSGGSVGGYSISSEPRTYVDNSYNRRAGRVGMEVGTAVISKSSGASVSSSNSGRVYVDNEYNRRLGRVGLPLGSAVASRSSVSSSSSPAIRTYVDNPLNRKLGRVGKPVGSAVYKPQPSASRNDGYCKKRPNKVYEPLYDFDPEDPNLPSIYDNITSLMKQNENNPEGYYYCEKAMGILKRYDAALTQSRSKKFERPKWLRGGEVIEHSDLIIGDKLGSGGFGDVHIAIWKGNFQVVVKKLRVQRVHEKKKMQFQEEVKVISSLNHPCIVEFYGACIETPNICIVMEFLAGGSLHDVLHVEIRPLSMAQKVNLSEDMLSALKYIHGENVAHRDIKTMNVLLTEDLQHCKLGDFGLALKESNESSLSMADHSVVGTVRYSSPEMLEGQRLTLSGCKSADIYATAITINELFLEEEPFDGYNQHQIRRAVLNGERPEPSNDSNRKVPRELKNILQKAWSACVNERPSADIFFRKFKEIKNDLLDNYGSRSSLSYSYY